MEQPKAWSLTQSSYYSLLLSTAIYDGKVRFYFAKNQEVEALKVYFRFQEKIGKKYEPLEYGDNFIYIIIYPNSMLFCSVFGYESDDIAVVEDGNNFIVGLRGPLPREDEFYNNIGTRIVSQLNRIMEREPFLRLVSECSP